MRYDDRRLKGIETCEVLVCSVLEFGMDHINNLKMKDLRVLLCYHFGPENLKMSEKKVELVKAVKCFLERTVIVLCIDRGVGVSVVKN